MLKEEAIGILCELHGSFDTEAAHARADEVLCEFLMTLGHEDIVEAWERVDKWYA